MYIIIPILAIATLLIFVWIVLLFSVKQEDWVTAAYSKVYGNMLKIQTLTQKDIEKAKKLSELYGIEAKLKKFLAGKGSQKEIDKLEKENAKLQAGDFSPVSIFSIPGYAVIRKFDIFVNGEVFKSMLKIFFEMYGRKYAEYMSKHLLAQIISFSVLGIGISLTVGSLITLGIGLSTGLIFTGVASVLVLVLVYALYDDISSKAKKRHDNLERQFPNVVSKLALLVTSGMVVDEAWKLTAFSGEQELYMEMRKLTKDREQNIAIEAALDGFVKQCNTKETSKLASAILQGSTKTPAELGRTLRDMAKESWLERKNMAKRDSEKAKSKLMIPTMMLFFVILMMIMVPIMLNFQTTGF